MGYHSVKCIKGFNRLNALLNHQYFVFGNSYKIIKSQLCLNSLASVIFSSVKNIIYLISPLLWLFTKMVMLSFKGPLLFLRYLKNLLGFSFTLPASSISYSQFAPLIAFLSELQHFLHLQRALLNTDCLNRTYVFFIFLTRA